MEIHLCDMLRKNVDLKYDFLLEMAKLAGVEPDDLRVNSDGEMINKSRLKRKLRPFYWGCTTRRWKRSRRSAGWRACRW